MKEMEDNHGSVIGVFDEFATFRDNLDKGSSGAAEKGRFLSLFNASSWKKSTKSSGTVNIEDPRFNLISYTQPKYACGFSRNNVSDGFFQRFLITLPGLSYILNTILIKLSFLFHKLKLELNPLLQYPHNCPRDKRQPG